MFLVNVKYYLLIFCFWGFTSLSLLSAQESQGQSFFHSQSFALTAKITSSSYQSIPDLNEVRDIGTIMQSGRDINDNVKALVQPPWYKTGRAYFTYFVLLSAGVYALHLGQVKRKLTEAEANRLKAIDKLKTRFYANITHEFRTPLTVIMGMAQQIKEEPDVWVDDGVGMIFRNANRLLELVNQILDLNKLESDLLKVSYQQSDIVEYSRYLIESFTAYAKAKNINIHFYCEDDSIIMDIDPEKIQQLYTNLLSNAIKFTPSGGNIYVDLVRINQKLKLTIRDTGTGISEKHLPYIFNRFYQVDTDTSGAIEGTGIGLALVREISKLIGAEVQVKSQLGKGTRFDIIIPIHHNAEPGVMPLKNIDIYDFNLESKMDDTTSLVFDISEFEDGLKDVRPQILIVEDNKDVVSYLSSYLSHNYRIILAKDGEEGVKQANAFIPDLIITDLLMPVRNGFDLCEKIKNDLTTSHIPIIMLTAKVDMKSKLEGIAKGADVYLEKPFNKDELLSWVKNLMSSRDNLRLHYLEAAGLLDPDIQALSRPERKDAENSFIGLVRQVVENNLSNPAFNVVSLSEAMKMSHSQLHRKLTMLTGLSAQKFIRHIRLAKAKALLSNDDISITEVCFESGFNDPNYFSRLFRQEFGLTPSAWRTQHSRPAENLF